MDRLLKATAMGGTVRIIAADTRELVDEGRRLHELSATATTLLGRMLTGGLLMGAVLKNEADRLTVQIKGDGPSLGALVTSGMNLEVKGYLGNPEFDLPLKDGKINVAGAVGGEGKLTTIIDMGLKEPYVSSVPIYSGEVAGDIAYYYTVSEQLPTAVLIGESLNTDLTVQAAGGMMIQMMPGHDPMVADILTYRIQEIPPLSTLLNDGQTIDEILNMLFDDMQLKINYEGFPRFKCDCSRERVEQIFISIGAKELKTLFEEGESEEMVCQFCNKKYLFSHDNIGELLTEISKN